MFYYAHLNSVIILNIFHVVMCIYNNIWLRFYYIYIYLLNNHYPLNFDIEKKNYKI